MKKSRMLLLKLSGIFILLVIIYLILVIIYAQTNNYEPEAESKAEDINIYTNQIQQDTFVFYTWNIGYCGLGEESSFFFDSPNPIKQFIYPFEVHVRPSSQTVQKNIMGVLATVRDWADDADFIALQEVDIDSRRSYGNNELRAVSQVLTNFNFSFGKNYDVNFVPFPLLKPMGGVLGGIATFSRFSFQQTPVRYSFPGSFPWPKKLFFLDRCFVEHRFNVKNGKQLVLLNTHNSAFDGGVLKVQEMAYLKQYLLKEYEKGNYVVVGGDWNQIPPGYQPKSKESGYEELPIAIDFLPSDWKFAFDKNTPTNRKVDKPYDADGTYTTVIDYFLLSPNIELTHVNGIADGFAYSDHQPVRMSFRLK